MRKQYLRMDRGDLFFRICLDYYDRIFNIKRDEEGNRIQKTR